MEVLILKYAHRVPELMVRALAGDPLAIAILAAMGIAVVASSVKNKD